MFIEVTSLDQNLKQYVNVNNIGCLAQNKEEGTFFTRPTETRLLVGAEWLSIKESYKQVKEDIIKAQLKLDN